MTRPTDRILARAGWIALFVAPIVAGVVIRFWIAPPAHESSAAPTRPIDAPAAPRIAPLAAPTPPTRAPTVAPRTAVASDATNDADRLVDQALAATDDDARERLLRDALRADPSNPRALAGMSELLSSRHADAEAHAFAQHCLEIDPSQLGCATVLVRSDLREHQYEAGRNEVDNCLRIEPHAPECVAALARLRLEAGDLAGAGQTLQSLRTDVPQSPDTEMAVGEIAHAQGHEDVARTHLQAACSGGLSSACSLLDAGAAPRDP